MIEERKRGKKIAVVAWSKLLSPMSLDVSRPHGLRLRVRMCANASVSECVHAWTCACMNMCMCEHMFPHPVRRGKRTSDCVAPRHTANPISPCVWTVYHNKG